MPLTLEQVLALKHVHPCDLDTHTLHQCVQLMKRDHALDWGGETLAMAAIFALTFLVARPLGNALRPATRSPALPR